MDNQVENAFSGEMETVQNAANQANEQTMAAAKDFGDNLRATLEKTLNETRARYAKTKSAVDEATAAIETSLGAARQGAAQFNAKAIETVKADTEAHFDHLTSLISAKSLAEVVTLNTEYMRKRYENATARAKTISEFARHVADETASPIREQLGKTFKFAS
jgi:phasin